MSGLMSVTGNRTTSQRRPQKVGYSIADITAGLCSIAICRAELSRHRVRKGQYIDLALLDPGRRHVARRDELSVGPAPGADGHRFADHLPMADVQGAAGDITIAGTTRSS
jgi:hypothetical protein